MRKHPSKKIWWAQDQNGYHGYCPTIFCIFKDRKKWKLQIHEHWRKEGHQNRFYEVKSILAGKRLAQSIFEEFYK